MNMKSGISFVLALLALKAQASNFDDGKTLQRPSQADHFQIEGRITNGAPASLGQFPYIASLLTHKSGNTYAVCGGSLIGREWILTAAHCVKNLGQITVYLGGINRNAPEVIRTVPNSNAIVHPDWNSTNLHNDLALVKVPAVNYSDRIKAVKLPAYSAPLQSYANAKALVAGWGGTYDGSPLPDNLQYASAQIISQQECGSKVNIIDSMMCTSTKPSSTCGGDSGGPLVVSNGSVLVGVVSFGVGGCSSGYPAGFTRVTHFLWWIRKHTGISY